MKKCIKKWPTIKKNAKLQSMQRVYIENDPLTRIERLNIVFHDFKSGNKICFVIKFDNRYPVQQQKISEPENSGLEFLPFFG